MQRIEHKYLSILLTIAFLAISPSFPVLADTLSGKVVGIQDGDTIDLLSEGNIQTRIRLKNIDAPEKAQPFGQASKQSLSELVFGKEVLVIWKEHDRYGRIVGLIRADGIEANREQVSRGMAWVYTKYNQDDALPRVEQEAREGKRGLWVDPAPTPPWLWRKGSR